MIYTFRKSITTITTGFVDVEANSEEEALEKVMELWDEEHTDAFARTEDEEFGWGDFEAV